MAYEQIGKRTIRQLNAILDRLPKHLEIKMAMPGLFGSSLGSGVPEQKGSPLKISDLEAMSAMFAGI